MNMTREDILRELELLPIWTLNPAFSERQVATQTDAIEPAQSEPIEQAAAIATTEPAIEQAANEEKIAIPWLFYCPLDARKDQDALELLNNMVRAMQLASTSYQIIHEAEVSKQYQPECTLIFGEDAATALLGVEMKLEDVTQQPYTHLQRPCWVVHHPNVLLENPALKREAWLIMCAAKAHMQQASK